MELIRIPLQPAKTNQDLTWLSSPEQFLAGVRPTCTLDIYHSPNPSLALMATQRSMIEVKALLTILISDTVDFFSVGKKMGDSQIAQTIDLILEDYSLYKPDYFILCFNRAKKGRYGKQYDRIDGQIIFEWLAQFDYEYTSDLEHEQTMNKKRLESIKPIAIPEPSPEDLDDPNRPVPMPENVKEIIHQIAVKNILPSIQVERTPEQIICDEYINDFKKIVDQNTPFASGKPYASFYGPQGRTLDVKEYLDLRITGSGLIPEFFNKKLR